MMKESTNALQKVVTTFCDDDGVPKISCAYLALALIGKPQNGHSL